MTKVRTLGVAAFLLAGLLGYFLKANTEEPVSLWRPADEENVQLADIATRLSLSGSGALTSDSTRLFYYTDSSCATFASNGVQDVSGAFTFTPSTTVSADATSVYSIGNTASVPVGSVGSVKLLPRLNNEFIFSNATGCVPVSCSASKCIYQTEGQPAVSTTLSPTTSCVEGNLSAVSGSPYSTNLSNPGHIAFTEKLSTGAVFAAVPNQDTDDVTVYSVNTSTGALSEVSGSPFAVGDAPSAVAFTEELSSGNVYAAVVNTLNGTGNTTISVFSVNKTTGVFSEVTGSPFSTGVFVALSIGITEELSTGNVYLLTSSSTSTQLIGVYELDITDGSLSLIGNTSAGVAIRRVAVSREFSTGIVAVGVLGTSTLRMYTLNTSTGALGSVGSVAASGTPLSVTFSQELTTAKVFAAVGLSGNATVGVYSIDTSTAAATSVNTYAAGTTPRGVAFTQELSTGNLFAAVANRGSNDVSVYKVNTSTGVFTELADSPYSAGTSATAVAFTDELSAGKVFVAVPNAGASTLNVYAIDFCPAYS